MDYIINTKTLYIIFDGKNTVINEFGNELVFIGDYMKKILENSCLYYGSTLKGRIIGSKYLINSSYKLPIMINEYNNLIIFKIKNKNITIWFNYENIKNYYKKNDSIEMYFTNNYSKIFNISWSIFNNQILKSGRLLMVYLSHVNYK